MARSITPIDGVFDTDTGRLIGVIPPGTSRDVTYLPGFDTLAEAQSLGSAPWKRMEALCRFQGFCKSGSPFNISGSTLAATITVKHDVPAPFLGVRMLVENGAPNAQTVNELAVGVTETAAFTAGGGLTASQNMSAPVIGGVAYDAALATSGNLGYRRATFAASATYGLPAGNTARQYLLGDWVSISSVPRADGGIFPLFLMRQKPDVAGYNFLVSQAAMRTPTAANRGRIIQTSGGPADGISVPSGAYFLNTNYTDTYPIFRFATPVLSVWGCGDSIEQGNSTAMIADGYSTALSRACSDVMAATGIPVAYANLGANSQNAAYYWAQAKALLALGVPGPSVLVIGPASINDAGSTPTQTTIDNQVALAFDVIATAKQYSIGNIIWLPVLPNENLTNTASTFYDDKRKAINATLRAVAGDAGIQWLEVLPTLGDGASPERWVPAYKLDAFHPNEFAHETVRAPALAAALRRIVGA